MFHCSTSRLCCWQLCSQCCTVWRICDKQYQTRCRKLPILIAGGLSQCYCYCCHDVLQCARIRIFCRQGWTLSICSTYCTNKSLPECQLSPKQNKNKRHRNYILYFHVYKSAGIRNVVMAIGLVVHKAKNLFEVPNYQGRIH